MRVLTIARAAWREAIRQPVSLVILAAAAVLTYLSQFLALGGYFEEATQQNAIREMAVASTLMCGMLIAVFTAWAVLAEEIENQTVLTLLAKPVRRAEVIAGKFLGVLATISVAFLIMMLVSYATVWWAETPIEKSRANPALVVVDAPTVVTGQGTLQVARNYVEYSTGRRGLALDYLGTFGDVLLLATGQSGELIARVPLSARAPSASISPGLASVLGDLLVFIPTRTAVLFQAFVLAFAEVMVITAVAIAVSTRLPLVFNALFCAAFFLVGNVSHQLGDSLRQTALSAGGGLEGAAVRAALWPVIVVCNYVLPDLEAFNLGDTLSIGIDRVPSGVATYGFLYGIIYTAIVLVLAAALFRRREVM